MTGVLVLVATPIGNLGDLTPRAIKELADADVVCCEDTRRTGMLLQHAGIRARRLLRVDEHTEFVATESLLDALGSGQRVVLVSDAGTPGISDPGERLVAAVAAAGHVITSVPGPVAAVAALVTSGLSTRRFVFEGFLARKGRERDVQLGEIAMQPRTVVLYESPKRTAATLEALARACGGDRQAVVARELTKLHEEIARGTLDELVTWAKDGLKGEVVIVVAGAPAPADSTDDDLIGALEHALAAGESRRDAVDRVAAQTGARRGRIYDLALSIPKGVTPSS